MTLEEIMASISDFNEAVRNSGGGHYNHQMFWRVIVPADQTGEPSPALLEAIQRNLGSLE